MLFALLYSLVRLILNTLIDRHQPEAELQLELLVVRHQLRVLQRQVKRPRWRPADRFLLVGLSQRLPRSAWPSFLSPPRPYFAGTGDSSAANGRSLLAVHAEAGRHSPEVWRRSSFAWLERIRAGERDASRANC
jgi:hypothetical protein